MPSFQATGTTTAGIPLSVRWQDGALSGPSAQLVRDFAEQLRAEGRQARFCSPMSYEPGFDEAWPAAAVVFMMLAEGDIAYSDDWPSDDLPAGAVA